MSTFLLVTSCFSVEFPALWGSARLLESSSLKCCFERHFLELFVTLPLGKRERGLLVSQGSKIALLWDCGDGLISG